MTLVSQVVLIASLCAIATSVAFWLASLKIKSELIVLLTDSIKDVLLKQAEINSQNRERDIKLGGKIRQGFDQLSIEVKQNTQKISQIEDVLDSKGFYRARPRLPEDTINDDISSF